MARADRALRDDAPNDYARPLNGAPSDRSPTIALYLEACRAGDHRSCWVAASIAPKARHPEIWTLIAENCRAGDLMSCRALPEDPYDDDAPQRFPDMPGADARWCASHSCEAVATQRECDAGFPEACKDKERQAQLATAGCAAGIIEECYLVPDSEENDRQLCLLDRDNCEFLGKRLLERGDKAGAQAAMERACQYGSTGESCYELAVAYFRHDLVEPVAGRWQPLLKVACAAAAKRLSADSMGYLRGSCRLLKKP